MIRIMFESLKDEQNLRDWFKAGARGNILAAADKVIDRYLQIRGNLQGPEKDLYYWIKSKDKEPADLAYFVKDYCPNTVKKEFIKALGQENWDILMVPENRSKITGGRQSPQAWLNIFNNMLIRDDFTTAKRKIQQKFNEMIDECDLISEEEMNNIREGSRVICQKDGWTVVKVFTYPASKFYGRGSGWCTTGFYGNGQDYFDKYMYGRVGEKVAFAENGKPYYLMYFSPDGRRYNVLSKDIIYIGTGKADHTVSQLPDDVPISIEEATRGDEYRPQGFAHLDPQRR